MYTLHHQEHNNLIFPKLNQLVWNIELFNSLNLKMFDFSEFFLE